jgi:predicted dehydrogenase
MRIMKRRPDTFKWGIIGCGLIAPRFVRAMEKTGEGTVASAASKSWRRAVKLQKETGIPRIYDSYTAMLGSEDLDAVYIATSHNYHAENARLCAARGIPVLIEKPATRNAGEFGDLIALANRENVFMMEALWTRFTPATRKLLDLLAEGVIGEVRHLKADFCIKMSPLSPKMMPWNRMYSPKLAGGALLDLGIYPVSYAGMVFGRQPADIKSSAKMTWTGVDRLSQYTFGYPDGARAELKCSFAEAGSTDALVTGTKGSILIPRFYRAGRIVLRVDGRPEEVMEWEEPDFDHEIREVHRCLREGLVESPLMPHSESLANLTTLDTLRAQWGMKYPEE